MSSNWGLHGVIAGAAVVASIAAFACDFLIPSCGFAGRLGIAFAILAAVFTSRQHNTRVGRRVEEAFELRSSELRQAFDEMQGSAYTLGRQAERRRLEDEMYQRTTLAPVQDLPVGRSRGRNS